MAKIALLFLTIHSVFHEAYWKDFLKGNEDKYSIYVHSKKGVTESSFFKPFELKSSVPTSWGRTLEAQQLLLQKAVSDPYNHKFIFLSESTIPFADFETIYKTVFATTKSIFTYFSNPHQDPADPLYYCRSLRTLPKEFRFKNWQWVVLNRKHACFMAYDTKTIDKISFYDCSNELYTATFLAIHGLLDEIEPLETTYVNWEKSNPPSASHALPFIFTDLYDDEQWNFVKKAMADGYLFGRRFAIDIDLSPLDSYLPYRKQAYALRISKRDRLVKK